MTKKNATCVNSVRFQDFQVFGFYGWKIQLPASYELIEIQLSGQRLIAITSTAAIHLRGCPRCKNFFEGDMFYKHTSSCKICHRILTKKWSKGHPDLVKTYAKKYNKKYRYQKKLIAAGLK